MQIHWKFILWTRVNSWYFHQFHLNQLPGLQNQWPFFLPSSQTPSLVNGGREKKIKRHFPEGHAQVHLEVPFPYFKVSIGTSLHKLFTFAKVIKLARNAFLQLVSCPLENFWMSVPGRLNTSLRPEQYNICWGLPLTKLWGYAVPFSSPFCFSFLGAAVLKWILGVQFKQSWKPRTVQTKPSFFPSGQRPTAFKDPGYNVPREVLKP